MLDVTKFFAPKEVQVPVDPREALLQQNRRFRHRRVAAIRPAAIGPDGGPVDASGALTALRRGRGPENVFV